MAEHAHTTSTTLARKHARTRPKPAVAAGNIVPLRAPIETTADIVADVQAKARLAKDKVRRSLANAIAALEEQHRARVHECLPIGFAMDRGTLDDWIEIGQRMLGKNPRRGA